MKPDDKPKPTNEQYEDPRLFVVIGDEKFPRTGLETVFVVDDANNVSPTDKDGSKIIGGVVCTCNKVRVTSCGCVKYKPSRGGGGGRGGGGCRCAPVH